MIWVKDGKFPLSPRLYLQMTIGMNLGLILQKRLVKIIYVIGPDIELTIID